MSPVKRKRPNADSSAETRFWSSWSRSHAVGDGGLHIGHVAGQFGDGALLLVSRGLHRSRLLLGIGGGRLSLLDLLLRLLVSLLVLLQLLRELLNLLLLRGEGVFQRLNVSGSHRGLRTRPRRVYVSSLQWE